MENYANPRALVSTDWVAAHGTEAGVRLVEVDVDTSAWESGHIHGAIGWNWKTQLCDTVQRDIIRAEDLEDLLRQSGIGNDTTIILYGDNNNWFAAWAYWQLKVYGHQDVRMMDGGRKKWETENRELTQEVTQVEPTRYVVGEADVSLRSFLPEIQSSLGNTSVGLVDVRSGDEFTGKILAPPGLPETCQRGGHIPGASNIGWAEACREDGTFKSASELRALYAKHGITPDKTIYTYCRIGERSSHSWFVLKELLGFPVVKNYDGSWTEWGNLVGVPVEK